MRRFPHLPTQLLAAAAIVAAAVSPLRAGDNKTATIDYSVIVPDTKAETFNVSATLRNISRDTLTFYFPIWAPGAYDIVNFGAFVHDFVATDNNGKQLKVVRGDTNTFRIIGAKSRELTVTYKVQDIENLPNSLWFGLSDIESDYAFAVGAALFGYPDGYKRIPYTVRYEVPNNWDIAIGLDPLQETRGHAYRATDYDALIDAPLQMGKFQRFEFTVNGKPHIITVTAPKPLDDSTAKEFVNMTRQIVEIQTSFFGEMPYDRYVFQHYLAQPQPGDIAFGALEHANSSTYRMPYFPGRDVVQEMEPVISHEYWHLWSPKRFHVSQLGPFDYQNPPRTTSLWFHEGLTEYYARLLLVRNGMDKPEEYLDNLNEVITPSYGREQSSTITDLSLNISEAGLGETAGLYSKGPILGLLLDAEIRTQTNNAKSLDDVMRYFNDAYGRTGRTFSDDEIIPIMEKVTGAKLRGFYDSYINGRQPLPYDRLLPQIGLKLDVEQEERVTFGAKVEAVDEGWRVLEVEPGTTVDSTGIRAGDVLTKIGVAGSTINLTDIPAAAADQLLDGVPTHLSLTVSLMRDDREETLKVKFVTAMVDIRVAHIDEHASPEVTAIRESMFGF